jgi:hypothetical protein
LRIRNHPSGSHDQVLAEFALFRSTHICSSAGFYTQLYPKVRRP